MMFAYGEHPLAQNNIGGRSKPLQFATPPVVNLWVRFY